MIFKTVAAFLALTLLTAGLASAKDSPEQRREKIRQMAASTLTDLYMRQPDSCVRQNTYRICGYRSAFHPVKTVA